MKTQTSKKQTSNYLVSLITILGTIITLEIFGFFKPSLRSRLFYFALRLIRPIRAKQDPVEQRSTMERFEQVILRETAEEHQPFTAEGVSVEWVEPDPPIKPDCHILYLHGGAFVHRTPIFHRFYSKNIANNTLARILLVDYRLAPEHPFPAALDDAVTAYRWMLEQQISPDRIAFVGDSAGGGLSVAVMLKLRELNLPLPVCAVLMSPWMDLAGTGNSIKRLAASDPQLDWTQLKKSAEAYCGDYPPQHPLISPLYADLSGLPPMLIFAGGYEILLDDAIRFEDRAKIAGVDIDLIVEPGLGHVWTIFDPLIPEAEGAVIKTGTFIRQHFKSQAEN
ncbi:MAG: alpha/beta hydrolase [Anaerolineaceae bacterium]|nr:alpha/beta hydrolase [Anaerolineaceae bacterium]